MCCRLLGDALRADHGHNSRTLRIATLESSGRQLLPHCEGTTMKDGTTPIIGSGEIFESRKLALNGYATGTTVGNASLTPPVIDGQLVHDSMAYDIEAEYDGYQYSNIHSPILCVTLMCSCGKFTKVVSRDVVDIEGVDCIVAHSNEQIAKIVIQLMVRHAPAFTYGHNVYLFDNVMLALTLGNAPEYHDLFTSITDSVGIGSSQIMGFILSIPGINNIDTYRYIIKQAMGSRFQ
jgi:DNA polymerase elongation subunit (family B)